MESQVLNEKQMGILENYHENLMSHDALMEVEKMRENRADGTETEEERLTLGYSQNEVETEHKHLVSLYEKIKKEGFDPRVKTFIIGVCDDKPGRFFLMDGQHVRAISNKMIIEGCLSPSTLFKYTINHYKSYSDMVNALTYINNGKPMNDVQISRLRDIDKNGKIGPGYTLYMDVESKYKGLVRDSLIKICIFGQHSGPTVFQKPINEYHIQLIEAYLNLIKCAKEVGADEGLMGVIEGVQHGMTALRDLYNTIFSRLFLEYGDKYDRDKLIERGNKLCEMFNKSLVGTYSPPKKGYTFDVIQTMLGYTGNNFKRQLMRRINDGSIKFYKYKSKKVEPDALFILSCIELWAEPAIKPTLAF